MTSTLKLELSFLEPADPDTGEVEPNRPAFRLTCEGGSATLAMFAHAVSKAMISGRAEVVLHVPDLGGEVDQVDDADSTFGAATTDALERIGKAFD